jgi:hypothetical protein
MSDPKYPLDKLTAEYDETGRIRIQPDDRLWINAQRTIDESTERLIADVRKEEKRRSKNREAAYSVLLYAVLVVVGGIIGAGIVWSLH